MLFFDLKMELTFVVPVLPMPMPSFAKQQIGHVPPGKISDLSDTENMMHNQNPFLIEPSYKVEVGWEAGAEVDSASCAFWGMFVIPATNDRSSAKNKKKRARMKIWINDLK